MKILSQILQPCALAGLFFCASCKPAEVKKDVDWSSFGGGKTNNHYSSLSQIDSTNAGRLEVAWTYHTGDADTVNHSQIQCNPIVVNGVMYATSPTQASAVRIIDPQLPMLRAFCTFEVLMPAASLTFTNNVPTIENNIPTPAIIIGSKIGAMPPN